jgi:large conductance mechanosensitive channel
MAPLKSFSSLDPSKKAFSLLEEFKNFALKGNVIDLAVGVIIGAAFGSIVKSMVDNIMMPLIGALFPGEQGYKDWTLLVRNKPIHVGLFVADVVNFLIVALALFIFIQKFLGFVLRSKKEEVVSPPPPTRDQELLTEIRDLLTQKPKA